MNTSIKLWFFENYWFIMAIFAPIAVIMAFLAWYFLITDIGFLVTLVGGLFSFIFFMQKQQHEELNTFRELFTEFNERYDKLNEKLNRIRNADNNEPLSACEKDILFEYFNLCGEEYLYYKKGYIYPKVWKTWCNGMKFFLKNDRIGTLWKEEENEEYYYGLTLTEILKFAVRS